MADLIIRGMEMPQENEILVFDEWHGKIYARSTANLGTKSYEVVLLPKGHGRLIDADAFKSMCLSATKEARPDFIRHEDWLKSCAVTMSFCSDIDEQPTIVPAEGGNKDGK